MAASSSTCRLIHGFDYGSCSSRKKTHISTKPPAIPIFFAQFPERSNFYPNYKPFRLRSCYKQKKGLEQSSRLPVISCLVEDSFGPQLEEEQASGLGAPRKEAAIDIKLPRRSLLVSFTCNACGVRSERLINRLAYERGLVYVQCSGCSKYHKLVDNLGLVVEYNLQEEIDSDTSADSV